MSSHKAKRNEETENFIYELQREESLWNDCSPCNKDKNMHHESTNRLMAKLTMMGK